ncbi:MAG: hypothetical protein KAJ54_00050 [Candidatus Aenigmarchaeota archaeon]|nr:hypothetical protein [Candidatus Aenigmarchaeota archaeon]MCK5321741.1 hypothetical protein [Candidatus Aenigmarchaeota archaeon]
MAKDYVGLVDRAHNYLHFKIDLNKKYNFGSVSEKLAQSELKANKAKFKNYLKVAQAEGGIASEVLSGKGTLEDFVSSNNKKVLDYVKSFNDFKKFQPNKKLDKRTKLMLRELNLYGHDLSDVRNNPMLTENIKSFGEMKNLVNPKRYAPAECILTEAGGSTIFCSSVSIVLFNMNFLEVASIFGLMFIMYGVGRNLHDSAYWRNQDKVLSGLNCVSASQVVKARIFDDVVKDVYSDIKK